MCPVRAVQGFIAIRNPQTCILFCHADGSPVMRYQFGAVLAKCIDYLGLPKGGCRTHSFRIGAASWLAKNGISDKTIKEMGRWKSDAFLRYIRL